MRKLRQAASAIGAVLGVDEYVLAVGLILLSTGLWPILGISTLSVPGAVLVWMALPQRKPLVKRDPPMEGGRKRS